MTATLEVPTLTVEWVDAEVAVNDRRLPTALTGEEPNLDLINQIKEYGFLYPILLREQGNGSFEILAGNRRLKVARKLGLASIPARITDTDAPTGLILAIADHSTRKENPIADYERIVALEIIGYNDDATICKLTGMDRGVLKKRRELGKLLPDIRQAIVTGKIKTSVAELAAKLDKTRQQALLPILRDTGKITVENVKSVRKIVSTEAWDQVDIFDDEPASWQGDVLARLQEAVDALPEGVDPALEKKFQSLLRAVKAAS